MLNDKIKKTPIELATVLLRGCLKIGIVGSAVAVAMFIFSFALEHTGKWPVISGILACFTILYTILSRRAYQIIATGRVPKMRNLVVLTIFNLIILGFPVGGFGFLAMFFGIGIFVDSSLEGLTLIILGVCAVLFFVSHVMTLVSAAKLR